MNYYDELVSIIIPVYNVQDYIEECLNSVLEQSYTNLEIICIDDGSKDNSGIICDNFSLKDNRLKVIHTVNQGLAMARNTGLDNATGKYIAFIDSDDAVEKDYILTLFKLLKDKNADIAGCRFYRNTKNGQYIYPNDNSEYDVILTPEQFIIRFYNDFGVFAPAWAKLYKASLWENTRFYNRRFIEDAPMIRPIILKCNQIAWLQKPLYFYRNRETSLINTIIDPNACIDWLLNDIEFYTNNDMKRLKVVAQKTLCYCLCQIWNDCSTEQKECYKKLYQKAIVSVLFHRGNTLAQRIKYTVLYFTKITGK